MPSKKQAPQRKGSGGARNVEDVWPWLKTNVAIKPIIDDPVSDATRIDNTTEQAIKQRAIDDRKRLRVPQDEPGGAGTFEPNAGNSKFK